MFGQMASSLAYPKISYSQMQAARNKERSGEEEESMREETVE